MRVEGRSPTKPRTGVVFFKLFYPTAQMTTFLLPSEVRFSYIEEASGFRVFRVLGLKVQGF